MGRAYQGFSSLSPEQLSRRLETDSALMPVATQTTADQLRRRTRHHHLAHRQPGTNPVTFPTRFCTTEVMINYSTSVPPLEDDVGAGVTEDQWMGYWCTPRDHSSLASRQQSLLCLSVQPHVGGSSANKSPRCLVRSFRPLILEKGHQLRMGVSLRFRQARSNDEMQHRTDADESPVTLRVTSLNYHQ